MPNAPSANAQAPELCAYLSAHLNDLGVEGWTVSVAKDDVAATQTPDGSPEPTEGSTGSPGWDDTFYLRPVLHDN